MNSASIAVNQEAKICGVLRRGVEWQVHYQGTYWTARALDASTQFSTNERVHVVGRQNLVLLIESIPAS